MINDRQIYDIALSYSRASEKFAKDLYEILSVKYKVFLDIMEYETLVCTYVHEILYDIFYRRSKFALLIISQDYLEKNHPLWEARTVIAKSIDSPGKFFIILEDDVDQKKVMDKLCINDNFIFSKMSDLNGDPKRFADLIEKRMV